MDLLLALLRDEAKARDGSESQWAAVLDLAQQENILPWTATRLRSLQGLELLPRLNTRLRQIHRDAQIAAFFWTSTLKGLLAAFHDRGIPVVSLKGPWLAERLCGDAALRSCCDLDLLVRHADVAQSEELLSQLGFQPRRHGDDHERPWSRDAVTVDLHHDVEHPQAFDFDVTSAWKRTRLSSFQGVPAHLLAPADELLFLCLHSARHRFERLSHILDLTFAFQNLPLPCSAPGSRRNDEIASLVALGSMMAAHLDPRCTPQPLPDLSRHDRERLAELAGRLWLERMTEPCTAVDWRAKHEFYLMMETRPVRRFLRQLRHLRILLTRLIEDDFAFAARFHLRQRWQVWLLRPVRLLLHTGRAAPSPP
jgi:hypothetical protein